MFQKIYEIETKLMLEIANIKKNISDELSSNVPKLIEEGCQALDIDISVQINGKPATEKNTSIVELYSMVNNTMINYLQL